MEKQHKLAISNDIACWLSMIAQRESLFIDVIINFLITSFYLTMHNQRKENMVIDSVLCTFLLITT